MAPLLLAREIRISLAVYIASISQLIGGLMLLPAALMTKAWGFGADLKRNLPTEGLSSSWVLGGLSVEGVGGLFRFMAGTRL